MSPWGRFYLEHMRYNPTWWVVFESWRMWGILDVIMTKWPNQMSRISIHLDQLNSELTYPGELLNNDPMTRGW
jgi:hypothetical protein